MNTPLVWRTPFSVWAQQPANSFESTLAAADDGSYFVAWTHQVGDDADILAQRRDATGNPIGPAVSISHAGISAEIVSVGSNSLGLVGFDVNGSFFATYDANLNLLHRSPLPQLAYSPDMSRNSNGGIFI